MRGEAEQINTKIMKTFKEVYQFPFENTDWGWVYDSGGKNFIFQWEFDDIKKQELLLSVINGTENLKNKDLKFSYIDGYISNFKGRIILIRGWGNLTSKNCFGFSFKEACQIQDTLGNYIVERLNFRE